MPGVGPVDGVPSTSFPHCFIVRQLGAFTAAALGWRSFLAVHSTDYNTCNIRSTPKTAPSEASMGRGGDGGVHNPEVEDEIVLPPIPSSDDTSTDPIVSETRRVGRNCSCCLVACVYSGVDMAMRTDAGG